MIFSVTLYIFFLVGKLCSLNSEPNFLNESKLYICSQYENLDKKHVKTTKHIPLTIEAAKSIFSTSTLDAFSKAIDTIDPQLNLQNTLSDSVRKISVGHFQINEKAQISYFLSPFTQFEKFYADVLYQGRYKKLFFFYIIIFFLKILYQ